jgi:hypothetical protein
MPLNMSRIKKIGDIGLEKSPLKLYKSRIFDQGISPPPTTKGCHAHLAGYEGKT